MRASPRPRLQAGPPLHCSGRLLEVGLGSGRSCHPLPRISARFSAAAERRSRRLAQRLPRSASTVQLLAIMDRPAPSGPVHLVRLSAGCGARGRLVPHIGECRTVSASARCRCDNRLVRVLATPESPPGRCPFSAGSLPSHRRVTAESLRVTAESLPSHCRPCPARAPPKRDRSPGPRPTCLSTAAFPAAFRSRLCLWMP